MEPDTKNSDSVIDMEDKDDHEEILNSFVKTVHNNDKMKKMSISQYDYHDYLINNIENEDQISSEYDTDDLIEDAKNFVQESQKRFVDNEVWQEIDTVRRQKRLSRKQRNQRSKPSTNCDDKPNLPFVPNKISEVKVGQNIKFVSGANSKVVDGVVKYDQTCKEKFQ